MLSEEQIVTYFIIAKLHLYSGSLKGFRGKVEPTVFTDENSSVISQIRTEVFSSFRQSFTPSELYDAVKAYQNPGTIPDQTPRPKF